jgi:hypothetical protein
MIKSANNMPSFIFGRPTCAQSPPEDTEISNELSYLGP